jgi:hypothetical protein
MAGMDGGAVLVTGAFGTGKTSLVEEMAETLERAGRSYAALDLDWFGWYDVPGETEYAAVRAANAADTIARYRARGVRYFLLAHSVEGPTELSLLRDVVPAPLRVVRLVLPYDEIARRLRGAPASGRAVDLAGAKQWLAAGTGEGLEDLTLASDRPLAELAADVLGWLGWIRD